MGGRLDLGERRLGLLDPVQVRQHRDRPPRRHRRVRRAVQDVRAVEGQAGAGDEPALGLLHHLDGQEEHLLLLLLLLLLLRAVERLSRAGAG